MSGTLKTRIVDESDGWVSVLEGYEGQSDTGQGVTIYVSAGAVRFARTASAPAATDCRGILVGEANTHRDYTRLAETDATLKLWMRVESTLGTKAHLSIEVH